MKTIGILGSTGSIGTQTLSLISNNDNFKIAYLSAYSNVDLLIQQAKKYKPHAVCIGKNSEFKKLKDSLQNLDIEILSGDKGIADLASRNNIDLLLNALVGYSGVSPTLIAIENDEYINNDIQVKWWSKISLNFNHKYIENACDFQDPNICTERSFYSINLSEEELRFS